MGDDVLSLARPQHVLAIDVLGEMSPRDDVCAAVHAALGIRQALDAYQDELRAAHGVAFRVRQGLNTGLVVVGSIGDDLRMDYTAVGDTTNVAARMQQAAGPGRVVVSEATHRLVSGYFEDLHWIDKASEELLVAIADGVPALPVLLVLTHPTGYRHPFGERTYHVRIAPAPLSTPDTARIAEGVLATSRLPAEIAEILTRAGEGNPFYVEEVIRSLYVEDNEVSSYPFGAALAQPGAGCQRPHPPDGRCPAREKVHGDCEGPRGVRLGARDAHPRVGGSDRPPRGARR